MSQPPAGARSHGVSAEAHHRHRDVTGGWLRPAVFGVMDGLVSNFALIAGVAGGTRDDPRLIALAGFAGLGAGAFSMAAGEYISVASQTELARAEIEAERRELQRRPEAEEAELAQRYQARGIDADLAAEVAHQISQDPEEALEVHTREELGVSPRDLPSPVLAAVSSFVAFAAGALLPLLPYLFGATRLLPAAVIAGVALFGAGVIVSRITAQRWWFGGLRQLLFGAAAAALTYVLGKLIGTAGL